MWTSAPRARARARHHACRPCMHEFASAQADWFVDPEGQADPDGGLTDDDEWLGASWDDEAWDYPGA